MRTKWLATFSALLGVSEAACRASHDGPAAARDVPSASASTSASTVGVAPSATATENIAPSATASATPSAVVTSTATIAIAAPTIGLGAIDGIGHNAACGATARPMSRRAEVQVQFIGAVTSEDQHVITVRRSLLRACAQSAVESNPQEAGKLMVQISIQPTGVVNGTNVQSVVGSISPESTVCMQNAFRRSIFRTANADRKITVSIDQTVE